LVDGKIIANGNRHSSPCPMTFI